MKKLIIILFSVFFSIVVIAQDSESKKGNIQKHEKFTCPMHESITKDLAGKCPICSMDLVKIRKVKQDSEKNYCSMCKKNSVFNHEKCTKCGNKMAKHEEKGEPKKVWICSSCKHKNMKNGKCSKCKKDLKM